jgi:hypothetical protein
VCPACTALIVLVLLVTMRSIVVFSAFLLGGSRGFIAPLSPRRVGTVGGPSGSLSLRTSLPPLLAKKSGGGGAAKKKRKKKPTSAPSAPAPDAAASEPEPSTEFSSSSTITSSSSSSSSSPSSPAADEWDAPTLPQSAATTQQQPQAPRMGATPGWYSDSSAEDLQREREEGGSGKAAAASFAQRLEAEGRALTPELEESLGALTIADESVGGSDEDMLRDIAELKSKRERERGSMAEGEDPKAFLRSVVNVCGTVLSYNFIIIIGFFLWFLSGCFGKFVLDSDVVIDAFTGKWEILILPLLSTHMGLTFFSAGIEKFGGLSEEPA